VIRVNERARVYRGLRRAGIEAVLHYVPPVFRQPVYDGNLPGSDRLPVTERLAEEIVCLPVTPELDEADVDYVIGTVCRLLAHGSGAGAIGEPA
jgi:UDP-2-acetamido-2-deoxy-ribo-hexuluronate aminotransferase